MAQIVGRYLAQPTAGTHTHQTVERVGRRTAETPNTPKKPNPPTVFINLFNSQPDFAKGSCWFTWQQPTAQQKMQWRHRWAAIGRRVWRTQPHLLQCQLGAYCGQRIAPTCSRNSQQHVRALPPDFDNLGSWRRHAISQPTRLPSSTERLLSVGCTWEACPADVCFTIRFPCRVK